MRSHCDEMRERQLTPFVHACLYSVTADIQAETD